MDSAYFREGPVTDSPEHDEGTCNLSSYIELKYKERKIFVVPLSDS